MELINALESLYLVLLHLFSFELEQLGSMHADELAPHRRRKENKRITRRAAQLLSVNQSMRIAAG